MAEAGNDKFQQTIEKAAQSARKSVDDYAKLAEEAGARFSGDAPADAGAWLQLTARVYAQAASDTARAWTTGYELLQTLAEQAEPPSSSEDQAEPPPRS